MRNSLLALTLALVAAPVAAQGAPDPDMERSLQAINIASKYAFAHFGAPSCNNPNANWNYRIRRDGDVFIADFGPKQSPAHHIRIVMRARDLKVVKAGRT